MRARYKGIEYQVHSHKSGSWKVESEIGDFYGWSIDEVIKIFRAAVDQGPEA